MSIRLALSEDAVVRVRVPGARNYKENIDIAALQSRICLSQHLPPLVFHLTCLSFQAPGVGRVA